MDENYRRLAGWNKAMQAVVWCVWLIFLAGVIRSERVWAEMSDWQTIGKNEQQFLQFDRASRRGVAQGVVSAWVRVLYRRPMSIRGQSYREIKVLNHFDCVQMRIATVQRLWLDAGGRTVKRQMMETPQALGISAEGADALLWRTVCQPAKYADFQQLVARINAPETLSGKRADMAIKTDRQSSLLPSDIRPNNIRSSAQLPAIAGTAVSSPPPQSPTPATTSSPVSLRWSYDPQNEVAPAAWGKHDPAWRVCAQGRYQSPITLTRAVRRDQGALKFLYQRGSFQLKDDGHSLYARIGTETVQQLEYGTERYQLEQITLHYPVREEIDRLRPDAALYLHHHSAAGKALIVVVPLLSEGVYQPFLQAMLQALREDKFDAAVEADFATLSLNDVPYYSYQGSLPVPPCRENVRWIVLRDTLPVAASQLFIFKRRYAITSRPPQPAFDREIRYFP